MDRQEAINQNVVSSLSVAIKLIINLQERQRVLFSAFTQEFMVELINTDTELAKQLLAYLEIMKKELGCT